LTIAAITLVVSISLMAGIIGPHRLVAGGWRKIERGWLVLTGGLVNIGGYYLRIESKGEGRPVVVMDAGLNQPRSTWGRVPAEVATFTRVVTYDRAGLGESNPGTTPRTSQQIVKELHQLLKRAGISGPYVLVGHSFGGLNVRLYASHYPEEVIGMVLIDASHEDEYSRLAAIMPPQERETYLLHEGGENYERVNLLASAEQLRTAGPLKSMPLIVISAGQNEWAGLGTPKERVRTELQSSLACLIPGATQTIARKSGHFVQQHEPELVVNAIRTVVSAALKKSDDRSTAGQIR
jgi:pimeloyl-ACP methyl ester carboxylesterase